MCIFEDAVIANWGGFTTSDKDDLATGTATIVEGSAGPLLTLTASGTSAASTWAFATDGNLDGIASATIANGESGVITLAAGKTLDYETKKTYVLIVM